MQDLLVPNAAHSTKGLSAYYGKKKNYVAGKNQTNTINLELRQLVTV